jgi:cellulose synthase/poly-beta-1,6-N-acetylglucosamine synthase-like glycosyltransferase
VKKRSLAVYYAKQNDIDFAISRFKDTAQSAYHCAYFPAIVIALISGLCLTASIMVFYLHYMRAWLLAIMSVLIFTLPVLVKWIIIFNAFFEKSKNSIAYPILSDAELPTYSVIVPIYKEGKIFPELKYYLEHINYPIHKLDIILLLEADDKRTLKIVQKHLRRGNPYDIKQLIIPPTQPRTKPKAMNVALNYIKGKYFVIFDAEDRPDPEQLKKAASYFAILPKTVGALQAKLSYHNTAKTYFLTRMFTLEYEIWFNHFLQGLVSLKLPIPLSGTSTHMRTSDILKIGGWDAYNVTEDCDLGIRLNAAGYQTAILDSVTHEEAVSKIPIWIKQRTRWMKGYLQTLITHLRNPIHAYHIFGLYRLLGIYAIVGGQVFSALLYPACWIFYGFSWLNIGNAVSTMPPLLTLFLDGLMLTGFLLPITQASMTAIKTGKNYYLILFAMLYPLYWLLAAYAAYRSIWQLIRCPFKWEKTPHGT